MIRRRKPEMSYTEKVEAEYLAMAGRTLGEQSDLNIVWMSKHGYSLGDGATKILKNLEHGGDNNEEKD